MNKLTRLTRAITGVATVTGARAISVFNTHASATVLIDGVAYPAGSVENSPLLPDGQTHAPLKVDATGASAIVVAWGGAIAT